MWKNFYFLFGKSGCTSDLPKKFENSPHNNSIHHAVRRNRVYLPACLWSRTRSSQRRSAQSYSWTCRTDETLAICPSHDAGWAWEWTWAGIGIGIWKYYGIALIEIRQKKSSEFDGLDTYGFGFSKLDLAGLAIRIRAAYLITDQDKDVSTVDIVSCSCSWLSKDLLTQILRQHKPSSPKKMLWVLTKFFWFRKWKK